MMHDANIEKLRDHFIVCGYGHMGRAVVDQLNRAEVPFVVLETSGGLYRELLEEGVLAIQGDANSREILLSAGIERARGICIVIDDDLENLSITITARSLNPKLKIITRAGQRRYSDSLRNCGADEVVIPEYLGGLTVGRMIRRYYPIQAMLV